MTILVVAQSLNDVGVSNQQGFTGFVNSTDNFIQSTTAGTFDATSVTYALALYGSVVFKVNKILPPGQTTLWLHLMYYTTDLSGGATQPDTCGFGDVDEVTQVIVRKVAASTTVYNVILRQGATLVTLPGTFTLATNTLFEIDLKWVSHATTGSVEVYVGQTLVYSFTGNTVVDNAVRYVILGGSQGTSSSTNAARVSEIICADEPTLRMKLRNLKVTTVDTATNWTSNLGKVTGTSPGVAIAHDGANSGNFSITPGSLIFNMTDIPVADTAKRIRGLYVTKFISRTGVTPIAGTRTVLDVAGTLYESANHDLFGGSENIQIEYLLNPATSQPWTFSEVNALKVGVKSV